MNSGIIFPFTITIAVLISPLAIAPMIDWTYSHFRVFMRLLAPHALLYTEMQTTGAIHHNRHKALEHQALEYPLALQLGGADIKTLVECAKLGEQAGYSEINLNLGCPSDRVQSGRFGACLMKEEQQVAACIKAMKDAVFIPVTAKTRIGIDEHDSYDFFANFAHHLVTAGCDKLIVHARKAWLHGLSPKQNRTIPPLHYDYAYRIKKEIAIPVVINGNIKTLKDIDEHLKEVDGVMLGRLACDNPYALASIHHHLYPDLPMPTRLGVIGQYFDYLITQQQKGTPLSVLIKPILNLAHGLADAKQWKKLLLSAQQNKQLQSIEQAILFLETVA